MNPFNPYSIVPILTGVAILVLGIFCYRRNHKSRVHLLFFLLCLSVVPWPLALGVFLNLEDPTQIVWWTKAGHLTCTMAPALYLDFVVTFLNLTKLRWATRLCYAYAAVTVAAMILTTHYFAPQALYHYSWGPYAKGGWLCVVDALFGCLVVIVSSLLLIGALGRARHQAAPLEYNRLKYLVLALVIFSFGLLDYLPKYGIAIVPVGSLFLLTFAAIVTYAIIRHQLLDFGLAVRRTAIYSILGTCITGAYFVAVLVMEKWFQGFFGYRSLIATSVVGFATALGFVPLRNQIQYFVDRYFFHGSQEELAAENEQLREQVQQTEKLKAVSTLAAGMAHEIKNPLASIRTFAEYLPEKYDDPEFRRKFTKIMTLEVDKMNDLVLRLLEFAKPAPPTLRPVRLSNLVAETLDFLHGKLVERQIQVNTSFAPIDEVLADSNQMRQVLLNVLLNSIEAMEQAGAIRITTARANGYVEIAVADTGPGIRRTDLSRIFDPFYTTKASGTGLGLSVVEGIVRGHGGRVKVESELGRGTVVRIQLPAKGGTNGTGAHSDR